jgi:hypothetical protein
LTNTTWMNLKCLMLSEKSKVQKSTYYVTPFIKQNFWRQDLTDRLVWGWPQTLDPPKDQVACASQVLG